MNLSGIEVNNCNFISSTLDYSHELLYIYHFSTGYIMIDFIKVKSLISKADRILLSTHENPDGDGLGCCAAMYFHLREEGKDCRIIISSELPSEYSFLNSKQIFDVHKLVQHQDWIKNVDLAIIFDVGDIKRLKTIHTEIKSHAIPTLNIDHHPLEEENLFTYNLVDVKAAAAGEILYNYLKSVRDTQLPEEICEGIYTAIMTDTGSFRHSNTNTKCHEIAIECFQSGVNHSYIYQQIYESNSKGRIKLLGNILSHLTFECDDELAWFTIDKSTLERCEATSEDVGGLTDFVRTIKRVEVALMIFQNSHNTCRINFRSKGKFIINRIANSLGGGGHPLAAGAIVEGSLDTVLPKVLSKTKQSLQEQKVQSK